MYVCTYDCHHPRWNLSIWSLYHHDNSSYVYHRSFGLLFVSGQQQFYVLSKTVVGGLRLHQPHRLPARLPTLYTSRPSALLLLSVALLLRYSPPLRQRVSMLVLLVCIPTFPLTGNSAHDSCLLVYQSVYGQCGGQGYVGPSVCTTSATCNPVYPTWYSQVVSVRS